MPRFSQERKEKVLIKLLPPISMSVAEVAREEGISEATLYKWKQQARERGDVVPGKTPTTEDWSAESKLATVIATGTMSESELSAYCREKGLYPEQVKRWKQDCLSGFSSAREQEKERKATTKADKKTIKRLESELKRKEKALAETAALLVLQKKLNAFWGEEDGEE
jgi:transposase-like protein